MVSAKKPQILVILGETASGKSELAMRLAQKFDGEIISADSWMVYKGFDIGTAKPTKDEQKEIRHYLIDVAEPESGFSAPLFKKLAEVAIKDIQNRDKLPILVGGTGLYIDSLLFDYGFLPPSNDQEREELSKLSLKELIELADRLNTDLTNIDLRNKRRVIRAIESKGQKPSKKNLRQDVLVVGIAPPRDELRQRVQLRAEQMLDKGLVKEVKELSKRFGWDAEPMKGIGYREFKDYFEGEQTLERTKERIVSSTMNLAKIQRTWFRRNKFIQWFPDVNSAFQEVSSILNN